MMHGWIVLLNVYKTFDPIFKVMKKFTELENVFFLSLFIPVVNVYVLVSLIFLYRMFAKGPLPNNQNSFVRFDNERDIESQVPASNSPQSQQQQQQQQQQIRS